MSIWDILGKYGNQFGYGVLTTILLAVIGTLGGLILGILLGVGRTLKVKDSDSKALKILKKVINFICYIYIQVFRGTPMMVQGLIFFLGIPVSWVMIGVNNTIFNGYFLCGSIVIVLNTAAYIGEIIRGGINSIDVGQEEGARSLGMSHSKTMIHIIIPQALKNAIPSIGNEFIVNIKDSSVLNVIGLTELFGRGKIVISSTAAAISVYIIIAVIYLVLTLIASFILKLIEKKLDGVKFSLNPFRKRRSF